METTAATAGVTALINPTLFVPMPCTTGPDFPLTYPFMKADVQPKATFNPTSNFIFLRKETELKKVGSMCMRVVAMRKLPAFPEQVPCQPNFFPQFGTATLSK